nr:hypothetical protein Iba_chr15dCG6090 [Ipomoea batatas]
MVLLWASSPVPATYMGIFSTDGEDPRVPHESLPSHGRLGTTPCRIHMNKSIGAMIPFRSLACSREMRVVVGVSAGRGIMTTYDGIDCNHSIPPLDNDVRTLPNSHCSHWLTICGRSYWFLGVSKCLFRLCSRLAGGVQLVWLFGPVVSDFAQLLLEGKLYNEVLLPHRGRWIRRDAGNGRSKCSPQRRFAIISNGSFLRSSHTAPTPSYKQALRPQVAEPQTLPTIHKSTTLLNGQLVPSKAKSKPLRYWCLQAWELASVFKPGITQRLSLPNSIWHNTLSLQHTCIHRVINLKENQKQNFLNNGLNHSISSRPESHLSPSDSLPFSLRIIRYLLPDQNMLDETCRPFREFTLAEAPGHQGESRSVVIETLTCPSQVEHMLIIIIPGTVTPLPMTLGTPANSHISCHFSEVPFVYRAYLSFASLASIFMPFNRYLPKGAPLWNELTQG